MAIRVNTIYNHLPQVIRTLRNEDSRMTDHLASHIQRRAKEYAPVLTGRLKDRIRVVPQQPGTALVVSDTGGSGHREYAEYNEYGTRHMRAQPYMGPAAASGVGQMPRIGVQMGRRVTLAARSGRTI